MSYGLKDVSLVCILYLTDEKDGQTEDFVIRIFKKMGNGAVLRVWYFICFELSPKKLPQNAAND